MALVGNISGSGGVSNTIGITGSLIVANPGTATFPTFPGSDVTLFISGNIASKPATSPDITKRGTTVFGGDVVISGTLFGGSPLYIGSPVTASAGIAFSGGAATFSTGLSGSLTKLTDGTSYIIAGTNITVATGTNGAITISSTAGGAGGGTNFFLDTAGAGKIYTTASSVAFPLGEAGVTQASDKGTAVTFYVSGSKTSGGRPATGLAVVGGDIQISGAIYLGDGYTNASAIYNRDGGALLYSTNASSLVLGQDTILNTGILKSNDATTALTLTAGNVTGSNVLLSGDIAVNGGDVTTTSAAATLFNSNATTVTIAGGATTSTTIGNATGGVTLNGNATVTGDLAVNGATSADITTTTTTATVFNSTATTVNIAGAATTVNIGAGAGTVTIPGNLTVNGTTTTVNTTNLVVRDPLIYFGSGSTTTNQNGGIALASGSSVANQSLVWGRVANDVWGAGRLDINAGINTELTGMILLPVRASKFEVGGPTAFVTSSTGNDLTAQSLAAITLTSTANKIVLNPSAIQTVDIQFGGTSHVEVTGSNGNAKLGAVNAKGLILSGNFVALDSTTGVNYQVNGIQVGSTTGIASTNMTLLARDGAGGSTSRSLILSGSDITLGAQTAAINFAYGSASPIGIASNVNGFTLGSQAGINLNLSGSNSFLMRHGGSGVEFQQHANRYLTINSSSIALSANTSAVTAETGKALLVGGTAATIVSGSDLYLDAGSNGVALRRDSTSFLTFTSGSGSTITIATPSSTTANLLNTVVATLNVGGNATDISIGASTGNAYIKNSATNISGTLNVAGTIATSQSTFNLVNTTATTVNFAGAGTDISIGSNGLGNIYLKNATTNVSGSIVVAGNTTLGDAITDTITFTARANSNLIPLTNNSYDLGTPDLRWRNMYTGDLHLRNERGDWTIIEESDFLSITNNLSGKRYKFVMQEI